MPRLSDSQLIQIAKSTPPHTTIQSNNVWDFGDRMVVCIRLTGNYHVRDLMPYTNEPGAEPDDEQHRR